MRNAPDLCRPAPLLPATARHSSLREKAYHWARKGFESGEESCLMSQVPLLGGLFLIHHISDSLHVTAHPARWAVATGSSPKRQRRRRNQHVVQRSLGGTAVTAGPARISLLLKTFGFDGTSVGKLLGASFTSEQKESTIQRASYGFHLLVWNPKGLLLPARCTEG